MSEDEQMGQLIDRRKLFAKKQQLRKVLPKIGEIFVKNFPIKIPNKDDFESFVRGLLSDTSLPTLDLSEDQLMCLDYQLQMLARVGNINMSSSLYYARQHMEKYLKISYNNFPAVKQYAKKQPENGDRIARHVCGMFSIAWQIMEDQVLVTDADSLAEHYAKKQAPK